MELVSFDEFYCDNWCVRCIGRSPGIEGGVCKTYRPKRNDIAAANVPLGYNCDGSGGFYLDYILEQRIKTEHQSLLAAIFQDNFFANRAFGRSQVRYLDAKEVRAMACAT